MQKYYSRSRGSMSEHNLNNMKDFTIKYESKKTT